MSKQTRVPSKHEMRRLKICEIFVILFFIIAVLAFLNLKEQLVKDELSDSDDFVDLGSRRNKLKEKFDENLKEELSEAEYERQLLQFLKS